MSSPQQAFLWGQSEDSLLARRVGPPPYPGDPTAIIVSVSGGVDSDATAVWARQRWPGHRLILWHALLADMDWWQTDAHLDALAANLGNCERVTVQAVYELTGAATPSGYRATRLRRVHDVTANGPATDADAAALPTLVSLWEHARLGMPPSLKTRYCTDYFKQTPFEHWVRANRAKLGARAVLLSGERWRESDNRARVASWQVRDEVTLKATKANPKGWSLLWARPVINCSLAQVTRLVTGRGLALHPGYALQGTSAAAMLNTTGSEHGRPRLSCVACIFTHPAHLATAGANAPQVAAYVERIAGVEARTGKTWRPSRVPLGR